MRHRVDTFKIGRSSSHRQAMLANMVTSLFTIGRIQTTLVKGKRARIFAEQLITLGKKGTLHHRRLAVSRLRDKDAVRKLFEEIAKTYADRQGGYTRVIKLGRRQGDAAEMCILELVAEEATKKPAKKVAPKAEAPKAEAKTEEVKAAKPEAEEAK